MPLFIFENAQITLENVQNMQILKFNSDYSILSAR